MQEASSLTRPELDVVSLRNALAPKLLDLHTAKVTGAQLAPLIDSCLSTGTTYRDYLPISATPRLRGFVERYLSELVLSTDERSGADLVYRIVHAVEDEGAMGRADGQLWKTFVALNPSRQLVYDRATAEIGVLEPLAEASEVICVLPSVTLEEHRTICEQFYIALEERGGAAPLLKALLEGFEPQSYPMWLRTLRMSRPPLDKEWGRFRQQALLRIFRERLGALGVPEARIGQLELQLYRDHEQAIRNKVGKAVPQAADVGAVAVATPTPKDSREKRARELLHAAVERMSYEQMQNLVLPFGVMLDLVNTSASQ